MTEPFMINGWSFQPEHLMTPAEVAAAFRVNPKTVARWADAGTLTCARTPGIRGHGQRRYSRQQVEALLLGEYDPPQREAGQ